MARVRTFRAKNPEVAQLQSNVVVAIDSVSAKPENNAVYITLALVVGPNTIEHKLGRKPMWCEIGPRSAALSHYDNINTIGADLKTSFILTSDTACTVTLKIY